VDWSCRSTGIVGLVVLVGGNRQIGLTGPLPRPPTSPDAILLYLSLCGVTKEVIFKIKRVETLRRISNVATYM
jgi:hypothetical protein